MCPASCKYTQVLFEQLQDVGYSGGYTRILNYRGLILSHPLANLRYYGHR